MKSRGNEAARLLLIIAMTIGIAGAALSLLSIPLYFLTPPLNLSDAALRQFTVYRESFYAHQPGKNVAFQAGCLATPFFLGLGYLLSTRLAGNLQAASIRLMLRWGIALTALVWLGGISSLVYCQDPPYIGMPPRSLVEMPCIFFAQWGSRIAWLNILSCFCIFAGMFLWLVFQRLPSSSKNLNRVLAILVFLLIVVSPSHFYAPVEVNEEWRFVVHINYLTEAISQVCNGRHLLVDFPHHYGGYMEFLAPILDLLPRRMETLLIALPLIHVISVLFLLIAIRLVIRRPSILLLTGASLLAIQFVLGTDDHYYQYSGIRTLFPGLVLLAAAVYLRKPDGGKYGIVSVLAAVASIWNFDTGIVLWLSWTAMLAARGLTASRLRLALEHGAAQAGILAAVWVAFFLYLRLITGAWPDPGLAVTFQKLVMESGYYCLRLVFPDVWVVILLTYLIALGACFVFHLRKMGNWRTDFLVLLSLTGVGLFQYFMGRSAESNLYGPSYVVLLVGGVLLDQTLALVSLGRLPRLALGYLLPVTVAIGCWGILLPTALPALIAQDGVVLSEWSNPAITPVMRNIAFVRQNTTPREPAFFLSDQAGFYAYAAATTNPIKCVGLNELFLTADLDHLVDEIEARHIPKLFVDPTLRQRALYPPPVYDRLDRAVTQNYEEQAASPNRGLILYRPRSSSADR